MKAKPQEVLEPMYRHFDLYVQKPDIADPAGPPRCHIELAAATKVAEVKDEKEAIHILVGAECMGPLELEDQVNRLKKELDKVLLKGKRLYETRA